MFCMERRVGPHGVRNIRTRKNIRGLVLGVIKPGTVEGKWVPDILIDTGCSRTMVHEGKVPKDKILQGETTVIRCTHGNTVLYPLALVELEMAGRKVTVEAAVSKTLPTAVLLGKDVAELAEILADDLKEGPEPERDLNSRDEVMVMTRAATRKEKRKKEGRRQKQVECEVISKPLEEETDSSVTTEGLDRSATTEERGTTEESATTEEVRGTTEDSATTEESATTEDSATTEVSATTEEERGTTEESATIEGPDGSATTSSATTEGPDSSATTDDIADAEESCDFINVFNDEMFLVSRDKQQQTRQEKRDARRKYREVTSSLDVTPEEFKKLQQQDTSLGKILLASCR